LGPGQDNMEKLSRLLTFIRNNHYIKDAVILFSGNGFKILIGFILNMVLAKFFGAENFAVYLTLMTVSLFSVNISDFGYGNTLNRLTNHQPENWREIFSTIFVLKITLLIGFLFIFYQLINYIALNLKSLEDRQDLLRLLIFLIAAESLFRFLLASLQAKHLFKRFSLLLVVNNSFRLAGIIIFYFFHLLTIKSIVILYSCSFLVLILTNCSFWRFSFERNFSSILKINYYALWVWLFIIFNTLFVKSDIIFINYLKYDKVVIGNYGLILTFISLIGLLQMSIFTQLLPKTSKFKIQADYQKYYAEIKFIRIVTVILSLIYIILLPFFLKIIYSRQYEINIFIVVLFGLPYLFSLFNEFNCVLLYAMEKHRYISIANALGLGCIIIILSIFPDIKTVWHIVIAVMIGKIVVDSFVYFKVKQCLGLLTD